MRWYEVVNEALAYKLCRPGLVLWLERANITLGSYMPGRRGAPARRRCSRATLGTALRRDRQAHERMLKLLFAVTTASYKGVIAFMRPGVLRRLL